MLARASSLFLPHLELLSKEKRFMLTNESINVQEEEIIKRNCNDELILNKIPQVGPLIS